MLSVPLRQAFPGTNFKFSTCALTPAGGAPVLHVLVDRLAAPVAAGEATAQRRVSYAIHAYTRVRRS